jgi:hypothetical protein
MSLTGKHREFVEQLIKKELIFRQCIDNWSVSIAATEVADAYKIYTGVQIDIYDPQIKTRWFDFIRFGRTTASLELIATLSMWAATISQEGPNKEYSRNGETFSLQLDTSVTFNGQFLGPAIIALPSVEEELMELEGY